MMKYTPFHAYVDTNAMQHYHVYALDMFLFSAVHIHMHILSYLAFSFHK